MLLRTSWTLHVVSPLIYLRPSFTERASEVWSLIDRRDGIVVGKRFNTWWWSNTLITWKFMRKILYTSSASDTFPKENIGWHRRLTGFNNIGLLVHSSSKSNPHWRWVAYFLQLIELCHIKLQTTLTHTSSKDIFRFSYLVTTLSTEGLYYEIWGLSYKVLSYRSRSIQLIWLRLSIFRKLKRNSWADMMLFSIKVSHILLISENENEQSWWSKLVPCYWNIMIKKPVDFPLTLHSQLIPILLEKY